MATKKQQQHDSVGEQLAKTLAHIRTKFGATAAVIPGQHDALSEVRTIVPCGIDVVDHYILGLGGLAGGRATELFSAEGGGKTTFSWTVMGSWIARGSPVIYVDDERSFDVKRAKLFGVDPNRLLIIQPFSMEEGLDESMEALDSMKGLKVPILWVWDSIASSQFKDEAKKEFDDKKGTQDNRSKLLGSFCRQMLPRMVEQQIHALFVNQTRELRGVMFGPKDTTPGGKPVKFASSVRVQLFHGKGLKDPVGQHIGKQVTFLVVKSRFSPPFRKAKVRLYYDEGWDNVWSTINHAKDLALVPKDTKATEEGYAKAVAALGWKNAAPFKVMPAGGGEVRDEADEAEWAGEAEE
jgi:recombination protein RecA